MFKPQVKINWSEDGENQTVYAVFPLDMRNNRIARAMAQAGVQIKETRCTHSYDCCAQWYGGGLKIVKKGSRALAYVRASLNV